MQTVGKQSVSWAAVTTVTGMRGGEDYLGKLSLVGHRVVTDGQTENRPHVLINKTPLEYRRCL